MGGETEMAVAGVVVVTVAAVVAVEYEGGNAHRGGVIVEFV